MVSSDKPTIIAKKFASTEVLPNMGQALLLKACLLNDHEAISNWNDWRSVVDIDDIDRSSNRLLPLLYHNLSSLDVSEPILGRYKGVYRKNWYKNQLLMGVLRELLSMFHEAGIKTMILKGAAMLIRYYPNYGLRPMADLDVLVPRNQITKALEILETKGWKSIAQIAYEKKEHHFFKRKKVDNEYFSIRASCGFRNELQREFDLHSYVLSDAMDSKLEESFWNNAESIQIFDGLNTHVLSSTDSLFHTIVHGLRPGKSVNLRWITDAHVILQKSKIDWPRLLCLAKSNNLKPQSSLGLLYLNELLNVHIPPGVKNDLIVWLESVTAISIGGLNTRRVDNLSLTWRRIGTLDNRPSIISRVIEFPRIIQNQYLLDRFWHVPIFLVYKGFRSKS